MVNMGAMLHRLKRYGQAIDVYERVVQRYRTDLAHGMREQVAFAFFNQGVSLKEFADARSVLANYDRAARIFCADPDPQLRELVAAKLYNKAQQLTLQEKYAEAAPIYQLVYARFDDDTAPGVRKVLALSLNNMAAGSGFAGEPQEERRINDVLAERFATDEDAEISALVARALSNAADARMVQSKQWLQKAQSPAHLLARAVTDLQKARSICAPEECSAVLANLGYAQFLSGDAAMAEQAIREAIRLGGAPIVENLRRDAVLHRLEPTDTQFEKMLTVWSKLAQLP
jgi:tetratricopeptide (TPR) repeat protein